MCRVYGFFNGEKFDVVVPEECQYKIFETAGVAIWGVDYLD